MKAELLADRGKIEAFLILILNIVREMGFTLAVRSAILIEFPLLFPVFKSQMRARWQEAAFAELSNLPGRKPNLNTRALFFSYISINVTLKRVKENHYSRSSLRLCFSKLRSIYHQFFLNNKTLFIWS